MIYPKNDFRDYQSRSLMHYGIPKSQWSAEALARHEAKKKQSPTEIKNTNEINRRRKAGKNQFKTGVGAGLGLWGDKANNRKLNNRMIMMELMNADKDDIEELIKYETAKKIKAQYDAKVPKKSRLPFKRARTNEASLSNKHRRSARVPDKSNRYNW